MHLKSSLQTEFGLIGPRSCRMLVRMHCDAQQLQLHFTTQRTSLETHSKEIRAALVWDVAVVHCSVIVLLVAAVVHHVCMRALVTLVRCSHTLIGTARTATLICFQAVLVLEERGLMILKNS